ncbi:MAG TPA: formyltetrahydrofolate deformylase [bacterium]|nr:formyltetrahydrofolate deformylase [bacterium]
MTSSHGKKLAKVRVAGPDHKGIIATVTMHLFKSGLNIEDIDQRLLEGYLVMNMVVDLQGAKTSVPALKESLKAVGKKIGMDITLTPEAARKVKHLALLVTREPHCLQTLLKDIKSGTIRGKPVVVLANRPDLQNLAEKHGAPFFHYPSDKKKEHERFVLDKLAEYDVDLIVLARYMQILSPEFCFRYEGKIINIHPSLLPSFPGARPYSQAFDKGVEVVGVTAHFVTTDLDQGPIICQDAFKVDKHKDPLEKIVERGKQIEAKTLARAVKLFCDDRLALRRGKVIDSRRLHQFEEKLKEFYG